MSNRLYFLWEVGTMHRKVGMSIMYNTVSKYQKSGNEPIDSKSVWVYHISRLKKQRNKPEQFKTQIPSLIS